MQPTFRLAMELPFRLEITDLTSVQKNLTTRKPTIPQTLGEHSKGCLANKKQHGTNNRERNAFAAVVSTLSNKS